MHQTLPRLFFNQSRLLFNLPKIFQFNRTPDVLTLFHSPTSDTSNRILSYLQSVQTPSTPPKKNTTTNTPIRFELDIIPAPEMPTPSQYNSIVEFLGGEANARRILKGINSEEEARAAEKVLSGKEQKGSSQGWDIDRPILVDWNNGRVVVGGNQEEVAKLVDTLPED